MSLKKKIILSFLISSCILAIFALAAFINFIEIKKEIRYLELSDTIRSKTLQLRRHEKNFFLYGDPAESSNVHAYVKELRGIIGPAMSVYNNKTMAELLLKLDEYSRMFTNIERRKSEFEKEFEALKPYLKDKSVIVPLIESTILERPLVSAEAIRKLFPERPDNPAAASLEKLSIEINSLRKDGEEILTLSKNLDISVRANTERAISLSEKAGIILFPLFFIVGLATLYIISQSVVQRLRIITDGIEKTGKGDFRSLTLDSGDDEVGRLIKAFNSMEDNLIARDEELRKKSEELLQSRKLASIGTLASGVAHELNNPLSNIYLAAQVLNKDIEKKDLPPLIKETVSDIFSQTIRMKRIVSDLLAFARDKSPELKPVDIPALITNVLMNMPALCGMSAVKVNLNAPDMVETLADMAMLEQVFINLFANAVDAMKGEGALGIDVSTAGGEIVIRISDAGSGIPPENISRIFDPFFSTKEKGTGLGLAIVYNIIEKHKGRITVESGLNKGTAFTITLPGAK